MVQPVLEAGPPISTEDPGNLNIPIVQRYYRADVRASVLLMALEHAQVSSREETRRPNKNQR